MRDADDTPAKPMRPRRGRRYRKETRYIHQRSEGLSSRRNDGSVYIKEDTMRIEPINAAQALSLDVSDPRRKDGHPSPLGPPTWYGDMPEIRWIVEGWNLGEHQGRASYMRDFKTPQEAADYAEELRANGDRDGKKYDRYDVVCFQYVVTCTQKTFSIEEARGYDGLS